MHHADVAAALVSVALFQNAEHAGEGHALKHAQRYPRRSQRGGGVVCSEGCQQCDGTPRYGDDAQHKAAAMARCKVGANQLRHDVAIIEAAEDAALVKKKLSEVSE